MQSMMTTILHARYEAGKLETLPNEPEEQVEELRGRLIRLHDLEAQTTPGGEEVYRC